MILAIIAGAVVILLIIAGWCAWRFLKKKRPKGADEKVYALVIIEHVIMITLQEGTSVLRMRTLS
jgi:cytochrome bd-type quinol oxidase subunit 1